MSDNQERYLPSESFKSKARINSVEEYQRLYDRSIQNPAEFWEELAKSEIIWSKKWSRVLDCDFTRIGKVEEPYLKWFEGGQLNVSYNCLDRHVEAGQGNRTAILWQGEKEEESRKLTYQELLDGV